MLLDSAPQTWNPQEQLFGLRIDAVPRQPDPLPVGVGAAELAISPRVAPDRVEHPPAERPEGAEAAGGPADYLGANSIEEILVEFWLEKPLLVFWLEIPYTNKKFKNG